MLELDVVITLHEHYPLGAGLEDVGQAIGKVVPADVILVDLELGFSATWWLEHLHHHGTITGVLLLVGRRRLRNQSVQAVRRQRRDDHEDDQQNQKNVDQRRNVNISSLSPAGTAYCHCHKGIPRLKNRAWLLPFLFSQQP